MLLDITKRNFRKSICINYATKRVRIKRGYGRTDGWIDGGRMDERTDEWRTDGWLSKNVFQLFLSHIRVLSFWIKRGHIRVLSKRIKRGYIRLLYILLDKTRIYPRFIQKDKTRTWSKNVFQPFLSHIRVLSKW